MGNELSTKEYCKGLSLHKAIPIIFADHIGLKNSTGMGKVFNEIFGNPNKYSKLQIYYLWTRIKQEMTSLKRNSDCFIVSEWIDGKHLYYVVSNFNEAKRYEMRTNKKIKDLKNLIKKCYEVANKNGGRRLR